MYRVLIADDENKIRNVLKALIHWKELGLELACECTNGDELLEKLERIPADIILTDMQMPGVSGVELLRCLRQLYPYLPIIVVSGYDDFKYTKQAIISNAVDYILKPVDEDELNEALLKARKTAEERRDALIDEDGEEWLYPVLARYFSDADEKEKNIRRNDKKNLSLAVKKYLEENLSAHITLADLEGKFYLNKEYISRVFKNAYGVTIFDYVDHLKIREANKMLFRGEQVKEIVQVLNYYDESHFYKKYKKIMGISPSDYSERRF